MMIFIATMYYANMCWLVGMPCGGNLVLRFAAGTSWQRHTFDLAAACGALCGVFGGLLALWCSRWLRGVGWTPWRVFVVGGGAGSVPMLPAFVGEPSPVMGCLVACVHVFTGFAALKIDRDYRRHLHKLPVGRIEAWWNATIDRFFE